MVVNVFGLIVARVSSVDCKVAKKDSVDSILLSLTMATRPHEMDPSSLPSGNTMVVFMGT